MNAQQKYEQAAAEVQKLLAEINQAVVNHTPASGLHYGHVGDLCHVKNLLSEVTEFLNGGK